MLLLALRSEPSLCGLDSLRRGWYSKRLSPDYCCARTDEGRALSNMEAVSTCIPADRRGVKRLLPAAKRCNHWVCKVPAWSDQRRHADVIWTSARLQVFKSVNTLNGKINHQAKHVEIRANLNWYKCSQGLDFKKITVTEKLKMAANMFIKEDLIFTTD